MRLHFPHGDHADLFWAEGRLTIGAEGQHRLLLRKPGVVAQHLAIELDPIRGIELTVLTPGADVILNGRPIQARALARLGDLIVVGTVQILLRSDSDERTQPPSETRESDLKRAPIRVNLRALSGTHFGKVLPIGARAVIGRGPDCDVVLSDPGLSRQHAMIENTAQGIYLRDLQSAKGTMVNGVAMRHAILKVGDQLAFESSRFLLESSGLSPLEILAQNHSTAPEGIPTPPQPVHTVVQRRLVPAPPPPPNAPVANAAAPAAVTLPDPDNSAMQRLATALMWLAVLVALLGLSFFLYIEFAK
jgi:pSer/pThr/pTyr-binding forkhead associated (FHA) protein